MTGDEVIRAELERLTQYNRALLAELNEMRSCAAAQQKPHTGAGGSSVYGVYLGRFADGIVEVFSEGRRLHTRLAAGMRVECLRQGETVLLDETFTVVRAAGYSGVGDIQMVREVLPDGRRVVMESPGEKRQVVFLSQELTGAPLQPGDHLLVDTDTRYALERLPGPFDRVLTPVPPIDLARVVGLAGQISRLRQAVQPPLRHRHAVARSAHAVLLYGPPGCGKSLMAAAFAGTAAGDGGRALRLHATHLLSKYVGETEAAIRLVVDRVRQTAAEGQPIILILEEVDTILRIRGPHTAGDVAAATLLAQFLELLDEMVGLPDVVVIGTTSREDLIDPAAVQRGRFDLQIRVGRPTREAAREMLTQALTYGGVVERAVDLAEATAELLYTDHDLTRLFEVRSVVGESLPVYFRSVASGAALHSIVARARMAALRSGAAQPTLTELRTAAAAELDALRDFRQLLTPTDRTTVDGRRAEPAPPAGSPSSSG